MSNMADKANLKKEKPYEIAQRVAQAFLRVQSMVVIATDHSDMTRVSMPDAGLVEMAQVIVAGDARQAQQM